MNSNDNFFNYFAQGMYAIISNVLPNYSNIAAYGRQIKIDDEYAHSHKVMDVFSIRFRDGNIVEFAVIPDIRTIGIFCSSTDDSFPDDAEFSAQLNYDMVALTQPPCINDYHIWPKGTWWYELADIIIMILNWDESGRLPELISSIKNNCGRLTDFDITPPNLATPQQPTETDKQ